MQAPVLRYDVVVVGLGIQGLSAVAAFARRGVRVLGIDSRIGHHGFGASWGDTRLIRRSYFEDLRFAPLLELAYAGWAELEKCESSRLLYKCGLLLSGNPQCNHSMAQILAPEFSSILMPLSTTEVRRRFPQFTSARAAAAAYEAGAGYLDTVACFAALKRNGQALGASYLEGHAVKEIEEGDSEIRVTTSGGTFFASQVLVAAGAWSHLFAPHFPMRFRTVAAPQFWFDAPATFDSAPCFGFFEADDFVYGFPNRPGFGVKIAGYAALPGEIEPDAKAALPCPWPLAAVKRVAQQRLVEVNSEPRRWAMCMYHLSDDENFVIARAPGLRRTTLLTGCSGHAFKFAPVLGDLAAQVTLEESLPPQAAFLGLR